MIIVYQSLNSGSHAIGTIEAENSALNSPHTKKAHSKTPEKIHMIDHNSFSSASPSRSINGTHFTAKPKAQNSTGTEKELSLFSTPHQAGIKDNCTLLDAVIQQIEMEIRTSYKSGVGILVLGEVHLKENTEVGKHYRVLHSVGNMACQSFTVLVNKKVEAKIRPLIKIENSHSHPQYPILTYNRIRIGFIHIPNKYANSSIAATRFLAHDAKNIDIFMGDTNIGSNLILSKIFAALWGIKSPYIFPEGEAGLSTLHSSYQGKGTNSTGEHLYDRCISRIVGSHFSHSTVNWLKKIQGPQPAFQFLGILGKLISINNAAVTYSDHNGLVISVIE